MTLETDLLGQKQQPCNSPALLPLQVSGPPWERAGSLEEPLPQQCGFRLLEPRPDVGPRLPGGTPGTHPQGVQSTKQRPVNRGVTASGSQKPRLGMGMEVQSSSQSGPRPGMVGTMGQPSPPFPTPPSACPLEVRSPVVRGERLRDLATAWVWFTVGRKS